MLQAVGQGGDELPGLGAAGGLLDGLPGQAPAEVDVLINGAGEDHVVLEHHPELGVELLGGDGGDGPAADEDAAAVGVVQPHEQGHEGGLAAARGPDDAQGLAGL